MEVCTKFKFDKISASWIWSFFFWRKLDMVLEAITTVYRVYHSVWASISVSIHQKPSKFKQVLKTKILNSNLWIPITCAVKLIGLGKEEWQVDDRIPLCAHVNREHEMGCLGRKNGGRLMAHEGLFPFLIKFPSYSFQLCSSKTRRKFNIC